MLTLSLICNLYLQIKPLVEPTRIIVDLKFVEYAWHDLVSESEFHNILFIVIFLFMLTNTWMFESIISVFHVMELRGKKKGECCFI